MKKQFKSKAFIYLSFLLVFYSCGVQQNLAISYRLTEGMTKQEVEAIMGAPIKSDFNRNVEEWHYCKTGQMADEYIALFFHEGILIAKKNYTVTTADTRGVYGSCEKFIKMGNYEEPEVVIEIRSR